MNETVHGVKIRNTIDNSQVEEGMKSLKRQLGVVNSEMKANLSAFDRSEKSMKQYQTRLSGLNEKLKVQKRMFNQVEDELKQVNSNYTKAKARVSDVERAYKQLTEANKKHKNALDRSNEALKASNAELRKSENAYKRTAQSKKNAYEKLKQLRQAEKDLKNSNQATTAQLKRASEATQRQANKHKELVQKYKEEGSQVAKLKEQNKSLSVSNDKVKASYDKTNTELKQTEKEFKDINSTIKNHSTNLSKAQNAVNNERTSLNNLERTISKTKNEMQAFNKEQLIANSSFTKAAQRADAMGTKFSNVGTKMTDMGRSMTVGVTTPITLGLGAAVKKSADFEQQMSKVGAVSQASAGELKAMSAQAVDLGAKTSKSASEVAEGMNELAQLGFSAKQVMAAMPGVISAAEASGADMATTATVMASSMNAFNIKAKDSGHVADMLATAANDSAADIEYMGEALKYAGTPAHSLGVTMEDTSAAIEIMSNSGLKGEQAGTVLRASFIRLAKPTGAAAEKMKEMGIHLSDNKGKFVGMGNLIGQFKTNLQGMTKEQKLATVSQIVGTEAASGFLSLIDAGPNKINKYSKSLKNSDGASKKAADQMKKNLKGALEQLGGAFESLGIQIGKDLTPMIQAGAKGLQRFVEGFSGLPGWVRKGAIGLGIFAAATGPVLVATGLVIGAIGKAAQGYAALNRQMAVNSAEAVVNAGANKAAAGSLATTGKATKGQHGMFSKLGNMLSMTTGRYGKLGKVAKLTGGILGKLALPITLLTATFGIAYAKMDWFRRGISDMGKMWNQTVGSMDFSWVGKVGKGLGKAWDGIKTASAKALESTVQFKLIKGSFSMLHKAISKTTDKTDVFGKGVSKGTKKALSAYNNLSEKAKIKLEELRINHTKIGNKQYSQIKSLYGNINREVTKQLDKRHDSEINGLTKIFNDTSGLSKKEEAKILEQTRFSNRKESNQARKINEQILGIYAKAHREKRALTKKENDKIARLQESLDKTVVKSLSKGEIEQKAILERMKQNKGKLSMQAASNVIKESAKERDTTIKDAKKKYKSTVAEAVKQRDETGTLSKSQANKVIKDAKKQYDESKSKAKKQHKAVVDQAQKQNKGVKKNIDAQTGHVKSKWQVMKDTSIGGAKKMTSKVVGYFKSTHQGANKWWSKVGKTVSAKSKEGYNGAQKWFSKTKNKSINYFKDTHQGANKWWNKLGNKIASESKGAWKDTGKWFSKTKTRSINYFKDTHQGANKWWAKLGSKIANEAKGAWKDTGKWFSRTKSRSINYFKDTHQGANKWWNKIGSKIADKTKDSYNSAKKWFNKTKDKSIAYFKDTHGGANKWWNKIGSKIADKSRDSFNSARKWFGKMYDNTKDRLSSMWGRAKDNFNKIANEGEDKSKKTHNSWKSWLGKTLNWLKNIKSAFGSAASDLGKSVANKAIDGLNGMIGGINKIAKAITDKNLIKTIPKLSTGTFDGTALATNSDGGLRQSTLAVVNDRGQGNAPGGGTQEVIERADGTVYAPKGRDVVVPLGVGDIVHSAEDTKRYQDLGILPRFSKGSKKKKEDDYLKNPLKALAGDAVKGGKAAKKVAKDKTKNGVDKAKEVGTDALEKAEDAVAGIWGGIKGVTKDVGEFLEHPGKLVEKVMATMGIDFGKSKDATMTIARNSYGKLKNSLVDKVKQWFEESGGDGDGSYIKYLNNITTPYSPNGPPPGYAFNWPHPGIDLPYIYEPVYSTISGTARGKEMPGGFGHYIEVVGGALKVIYGHLSKWLIKQGQHVTPGTKLGISGNTGASTGPHLHYEMHKNGKPIDPVKWLKTHNGKGQNKKASAWASDIRRAAKQMRVSITQSDINGITSLIQHESGGNAGITQSAALKDGNYGANLAKGLLQYVPGTFNNYKVRGHGNIFNGYDQLLAFFNNRNWRSQYNPNGGWSPSGPRRYENGGISSQHQLAEISEKNRAEMVVPLHRTKRTRAIQLIEQAMSYVGMNKGKTEVTVNNDNSTIEKLLKQLVRVNDQNNKLTQTIISLLGNQKQGSPKDAANVISQILGENMRMASYSQGG